jgi:hypothetical protein
MSLCQGCVGCSQIIATCRLTEFKLKSKNETDQEVPGQPLLLVSEEQKVLDFLARDLRHDHLNRLYPIFWLVSTPRSDHISPLHNQIVRGRNIVITEDPGLHLLWYYDRVFIKPLPPYLTSHAFWKEFLCRESSADLRRAALGYVRSYCYLIKSQSDFYIAEEKKLIQKGVDMKALLYFLRSFESVSDDEVTLRYRHGELRLTRINFYVKFYERRLFYRKMQWQYSDYLNSIVAPLVFIFALVSVALSAMQVVLAAQQPNGNQTHGWQKFTSVSQWSAVVFLILVALCTLFFPSMVGILLLRELLFALGCRFSRQKVGRT